MWDFTEWNLLQSSLIVDSSNIRGDFRRYKQMILKFWVNQPKWGYLRAIKCITTPISILLRFIDMERSQGCSWRWKVSGLLSYTSLSDGKWKKSWVFHYCISCSRCVSISRLHWSAVSGNFSLISVLSINLK